MATSRVQFQCRNSLPKFNEIYGTEEKCEDPFEQASWPEGFIFPQCGAKEHCIIYPRISGINAGLAVIKLHLNVVTVLVATKLPRRLRIKNQSAVYGGGSIDEAGLPFYVKLSSVSTFSFAAIADWSQVDLTPGCHVISDGLPCFSAVAGVG